MTNISFNTAWISHVNEVSLSEQLDKWGFVMGFRGVLNSVTRRGGAFANWHLLTMPDSFINDYLQYAIEIACIYPNHDYVKTFLAWANEAGERALSDIRFTYDPDEERLKGNADPLAKRGWMIPGIFPGNHGSTLAAACLARAMRDNSALDEASLLVAAEEIAQSALDTTSNEWASYTQTQSDYLRSIRLALIAGRVDKALALFKNNRRKFKATQVHHTWLFELCRAIEAANGAALQPATVEAFQGFFDQVRNPEIRSVGSDKDGTTVSINISLLRLELALIKQRHVLLLPFEGQWTEVLGLISE